MGIEITMLIAIGALFVGYMVSIIICLSDDNCVNLEDLEREYNKGYESGYNDALDDVEHDLNVDLKEYRDS